MVGENAERLGKELEDRAALVKAKKDAGQPLSIEERAVLVLDHVLHGTLANRGNTVDQMDAIAYHLRDFLPPHWENEAPAEEDEDGEEEGADE